MFVYLINAWLTILFYIEMYFWFFILFVCCFIWTILDYKQRTKIFVNDERGIV